LANLLWTITIILLVAWILGLVGVYAAGNWIHTLLVVALVTLIINLVSASAHTPPGRLP
jgi:uncharacterized membrane protein YtjA (UPF0391 family)